MMYNIRRRRVSECLPSAIVRGTNRVDGHCKWLINAPWNIANRELSSDDNPILLLPDDLDFFRIPPLHYEQKLAGLLS